MMTCMHCDCASGTDEKAEEKHRTDQPCSQRRASLGISGIPRSTRPERSIQSAPSHPFLVPICSLAACSVGAGKRDCPCLSVITKRTELNQSGGKSGKPLAAAIPAGCILPKKRLETAILAVARVGCLPKLCRNPLPPNSHIRPDCPELPFFCISRWQRTRGHRWIPWPSRPVPPLNGPASRTASRLCVALLAPSPAVPFSDADASLQLELG